MLAESRSWQSTKRRAKFPTSDRSRMTSLSWSSRFVLSVGNTRISPTAQAFLSQATEVL